VFATKGGSEPAIVRVARGTSADELATQWSAAMKLKHPSLVQTLETGQTEILDTPLIYTATQPPDDSLSEAVAARSLTAEEAREVLNSVLDGLSYLHSQGFVHARVAPENIVAIGDKIKLSPWTISKGGPQEMAKDLEALGQTVVEILTQKKPESQSPAVIASLPAPFRQLAKQCATGRCTVKEAMQAMRGEIPQPEVAPVPEVVPVNAPAPEQPKFLVEEPARSGMGMRAVLGAAAAVLLVIFGVRAYTRIPPAESTRERVTITQPNLPAPAPAPQRTAAPPVALPPVTEKKKTGDWAVVAAIYNNYDQARHRAELMSKRSKRLQPDVFPPAGQGRRYMVVLGYGHSAKEAEQILRRAHADGMPSDAYVTRISR